MSPLRELCADERRGEFEHLPRRVEDGPLAVEPERAVVGLGVDAQLPEAVDALFGGAEQVLQPQVLDERVAVLWRELDGKVEEGGGRVEVEAVGEGVEADARALAPDLCTKNENKADEKSKKKANKPCFPICGDPISPMCPKGMLRKHQKKSKNQKESQHPFSSPYVATPFLPSSPNVTTPFLPHVPKGMLVSLSPLPTLALRAAPAGRRAAAGGPPGSARAG